jgi:hypothetical protein
LNQEKRIGELDDFIKNNIMKELFISECTEYEAGWGSKPDGYLISENVDVMNAEIKRITDMDSQTYYLRFTEPKKIFCEEKAYDLIVEKFEGKGFSHYGNNGLREFELYEKINK